MKQPGCRRVRSGATLIRRDADNPGILPAITTPDKVQTRLGTLEFKDGIPLARTPARMLDPEVRLSRLPSMGALVRLRPHRTGTVASLRIGPKSNRQLYSVSIRRPQLNQNRHCRRYSTEARKE